MKVKLQSPRLVYVWCLIAGALVPLSLAPFEFWYVAPACLATFLFALQEGNPNTLLLRSWSFGIGLFGSGVSWVYVSIHEYGYAPAPLAALLTALFVIGLGFVFALPFWMYGKFFQSHRLSALIAFPALWILGEWLRSWLLTGFPWLYLGYAHVNTPLAGWLPVGGVFAVSWMVVFSGAALFVALRQQTFYPLCITVLLFASGYGLQRVQWTQLDAAQPISVGIVQPNFSLHDKWNPEKRSVIRQTLVTLSEPLWEADIILWPEAALNELYHEALPFLQLLDNTGKHNATTLITGILTYDTARSTFANPVIYNSVVALGTGNGLYHKVRLVPFGEYVPLESWLRGLIRFFDLPTSHMSPGAESQKLLEAGNYRVSPFICYEIVYPDLVAHNSRDTNFLITISNDSWFGDSLGPQQHLQMAQVRALETGRYVMRGTNDGISAIIDPQGKLQQASTRFKQQTLNGEIYPAKGNTPFMLTGSLPLMLLMIGVLGIYGHSLKRRQP